ncbi:MAG TPA: hypothetical protein VF018_08095 [Acidobacteriaceae bacterium]
MPARTRFAVILSAILLVPALFCAQGTAQDTQGNPEASSQQTGPHLKLVYRTLQIGADGKTLSSHSYSIIVFANSGHASPSKIRSNDRVPIPSGYSGGNSQVVTQYQYQDVGTNIDTSGAKLSGNQLTVYLSVSMTEVAKNDVAPEKAISAPVVRQLSWQSDVIVTVGRPTIVFTSDNPSDTGKTELELTATEIKQL